MKKKVEEVLDFEDFGGKRGAKMDQDDFLLCVQVAALNVKYCGWVERY